MQIDKVTFNDLSIFSSDEESSVFHLLDRTRTVGGREWMRRIFRAPHTDIEQIVATQELLRRIMEKDALWPADITNGTLLVIEKLYDTNIDEYPERPNPVQAFSYRIFHGPDYALIKFTLPHCIDFLKGVAQLLPLLGVVDALPKLIKSHVERAAELLQRSGVPRILKTPKGAKLSTAEMLRLAHFFLHAFREHTLELIQIYYRLDAYYGMAKSAKELKLAFPEMVHSEMPILEIDGLYHPLLPTPVAYNTELNSNKNFLFLTGANMAGKSTFIKAVGISVFLAHLGMGVPAASMRLSLFNGLLSNIQVMDNILKGESYFFNEVQRIKNTILTINDSRKWLILIDELFKGTNVQDAMKCSLAVINGLVRIKHSLFILSTHLYEIGEELKAHPNIVFRFFETNVKDDQLEFSYQLKEGISNDRLGYLILKREKVTELLDKL